MRELERQHDTPALRVAIVGRGRLGTALARALRERGLDVAQPAGRHAELRGSEVVILCVPDSEIAAAAAAVPDGAIVGHCSGATGLDVLAPHERLSLHPLMTFAADDGADRFAGAGAAIAGSTSRALEIARALAERLDMVPLEIEDGDRVAYHAAASIASNFLVTLEAAAERLAADAGADRSALVPLVRATVENWARLGAERALTGPVARGDESTVAAQRAAVARREPELLTMFDALVDATRTLASARTLTSSRTPSGARSPSGMRTVTTVSELRAALAPARRAGRSIGLVPTMGAFHDGHLSLMRRARSQCDLVVVSLFVNPAQFNDAGDLAAYPRDERRDADLAAAAGVDILFAPSEQEVYPPGFATAVTVHAGTDQLEGAFRGRGHFEGVATVVTKLLNMAAPDVAFFGQKDAQQAAIIRRLVRDLHIPVRIEVCPTQRAADGLALSSRNALLSPAERERAAALHRALDRVRESVLSGADDPSAATAAGLAELRSAGIEPEYLELVSADTLAPLDRVNGDALAVVAARVGTTRLIDNELIVRGDGRQHPTPNEVATPPEAPTSV
jgi:pantoate--beta-alanine ligase